MIADAEAIAGIYNAEVLGSTATFDLVPRTVEQQRAWQIDRSGAHAVLVAETTDGEVVGFASLSPFRDRPAYATTVESSIYVDPTQQRRGVGLLLLESLIETARSHGFHSIIARVAGSSEASVQLHLRAGFDIVGVEREVGRKFNRWLDVTVMQLLVRDSPRHVDE
jgi:phosphinothricin acetyltransferase